MPGLFVVVRMRIGHLARPLRALSQPQRRKGMRHEKEQLPMDNPSS
jgi:hypothetical protein